MLSRKPIEPGQIFYIIKQGFDFIQSVSQPASQPASQSVSQLVRNFSRLESKLTKEFDC